MAENKKGFLMYADFIHTFGSLNDEEAGRLIKHIFKYVNDEDPTPPDRITQIAFEPIKQQFKRDLQKWESTKSRYSDAGIASANARKLSKPQFYILRMFNEEESFLKIGITSNSVTRRYSSSGEKIGKLPYKYEVVYQYFETETSIDILEIERVVGNKFKEHTYEPLIQFPGHHECFSLDLLDSMLKFVENISTTFNNVQQRSTKSTVNDNVNVTVNVNDNETVNKKKEDIDVRKLKFAETLKPFLEIYGKNLCNDFYKYWTEPNRSNTKFRQETEKTWDIARRLETWAKNDKNFAKNLTNGKPESKLDSIQESADYVLKQRGIDPTNYLRPLGD